MKSQSQKASARFRRVILVVKKSVWETRAEARPRHRTARAGLAFAWVSPAELKRSHRAHYGTVRRVTHWLKSQNIPFRIYARAEAFRAAPKDLVMTVGGDGTFLETARCVRKNLLVGCNSDERRSIGKLCVLTSANLESGLGKLFFGARVRISRIPRFAVRINQKMIPTPVMNEVLICHENPAAMSHYWIRVGQRRENHHGSGLWVATAAGSTGAIGSAGGKALKPVSKSIQYRARELYPYFDRHPGLRGGLLRSCREISIGCMMSKGRIYFDGEHVSMALRREDVVDFVPHEPLRTWLK